MAMRIQGHARRGILSALVGGALVLLLFFAVQLQRGFDAYYFLFQIGAVPAAMGLVVLSIVF